MCVSGGLVYFSFVVSGDLMSFADEHFVIKLTSDLSVTGLVSHL